MPTPSNSVITPSVVLKESYAIMHQASNFFMRVGRQYDRYFGEQTQFGKISETLNVRLPAKYQTRRGEKMVQQNYVQRSVPLTLAETFGIDLQFGQRELSFSINEFSENVLKPAVTQLAASIESWALQQAVASVGNFAGAVTTSVNFASLQNAGRYLSENLAPSVNRNMILNPQSRVDFSNDVKGLFQSSNNIADQYVQGKMGETAGFMVYENTAAPTWTPGTFNGTLSTTISTTADSGAGAGDVTGVNTWTSTFGLKFDVTTSYNLKKGDVITIGGVFDISSETKQSYGTLKRFVLAASTSGTTTGTLTISPAPILTGAYQNVSTGIADNAAILVLGSTSNTGTTGATTYGVNLGFQKDAFQFVSADLINPAEFGAWGDRQVFEDLSMRVWRQGDIANGTIPTRLDVVVGFAPIYPEWAVRLVHSVSA